MKAIKFLTLLVAFAAVATIQAVPQWNGGPFTSKQGAVLSQYCADYAAYLAANKGWLTTARIREIFRKNKCLNEVYETAHTRQQATLSFIPRVLTAGGETERKAELLAKQARLRANVVKWKQKHLQVATRGPRDVSLISDEEDVTTDLDQVAGANQGPIIIDPAVLETADLSTLQRIKEAMGLGAISFSQIVGIATRGQQLEQAQHLAQLEQQGYGDVLALPCGTDAPMYRELAYRPGSVEEINQASQRRLDSWWDTFLVKHGISPDEYAFQKELNEVGSMLDNFSISSKEERAAYAQERRQERRQESLFSDEENSQPTSESRAKIYRKKRSSLKDEAQDLEYAKQENNKTKSYWSAFKKFAPAKLASAWKYCAVVAVLAYMFPDCGSDTVNYLANWVITAGLSGTLISGAYNLCSPLVK